MTTQKIGPNADRSAVHESIGIPGYLNTGVAPAYGTADSNGYVGVSGDYNSHANATDRPTPGSVKLGEGGADEEEGDIKHLLNLTDHGGPILADGDGNEITEDNDVEADNVRGVEVTEADLNDGESVNHLGKLVSADENKPTEVKRPAKKAAPKRPVGSEKSDD